MSQHEHAPELPAVNRYSINAQTNAIRMNCETIRMVMASLAEQHGSELDGHDTVLVTLNNIAASCGVIEQRANL